MGRTEPPTPNSMGNEILYLSWIVCTAVGVSVPSDSFDRASEVICGFAEVTHCYQRGSDFNIWFTLIARDEDRVEEILAQIKVQLSLEDAQVLNVPVLRLFKLDARFDASARPGPSKGKAAQS